MRGAKRHGGFASLFSFSSNKNANPARPASRSEVDAPFQISSPTDFKRVGHISYRSATGLFSGLEGAPVILFFGVPVTSQPRVDVKGYTERIPSILVLLAKELIKRDGLDAEGIFRVPGESMSIERGRAILNAGRGLTGLESEPGPHVIASLFKDWFRSLSPADSILKSLTNDMVRELAKDGVGPADAYFKVCAILSEPNLSIFCWVIDLLAVVCQHGKKNLMSPTALGTVFSPTLRFPTETTMEAFAIMADVSKVLERCIQHAIAQGDLQRKELIFSSEDQ